MLRQIAKAHAHKRKTERVSVVIQLLIAGTGIKSCVFALLIYESEKKFLQIFLTSSDDKIITVRISRRQIGLQDSLNLYVYIINYIISYETLTYRRVHK